MFSIFDMENSPEISFNGLQTTDALRYTLAMLDIVYSGFSRPAKTKALYVYPHTPTPWKVVHLAYEPGTTLLEHRI
jgi:hypothetical protein